MDSLVKSDDLCRAWFEVANLSAELKAVASHFYEMCALNPVSGADGYQKLAHKISQALENANATIKLYAAELLHSKDTYQGLPHVTSLQAFMLSVLTLNHAVEHAKGVVGQALLDVPAEGVHVSSLQDGLACSNGAASCLQAWQSIFDALSSAPKLI